MEQSVSIITLPSLAIAFIPVVIVFIILIKWSISVRRASHAVIRMLVQLLLVGYCLGFIFSSNKIWLIGSVLVVMVLFSSWIALNNIQVPKKQLIGRAIFSISVSGFLTLLVISQGVLTLTPWYHAQTLLPLAGMIFASCMNSISLSGERYFAELAREATYYNARNTAFSAAMIPNINALFAVGIVSLPGMMTGQIIAGVEPVIAARYQIMVMCMLFASGGISAALFLMLIKDKKTR